MRTFTDETTTINFPFMTFLAHDEDPKATVADLAVSESKKFGVSFEEKTNDPELGITVTGKPESIAKWYDSHCLDSMPSLASYDLDHPEYEYDPRKVSNR
jgi:hypothetical protein